MSNEIPDAINRGLIFFPVPEFTDSEVAYGADVGRYFHRRDRPKIPKEFTKKAMDIFFSGGTLPEFDPRIDKVLARRAVRAWLSSFAPSHESKEATVGYAFWVWSNPESLDAA